MDIKILIVEDQVLIANHIKNILGDANFHTVEMAFKINSAIEKLNSFVPDVILLDINVEGRNTGIDWAEEYVKDAKIIFITGQNEMSTLEKALTVDPIAYLTKPVREIDLLAALQVAKKQFNSNYVIVKDGFNELKLNYEQILFIKSERNYIDIQTIDKKLTIRNTLDGFLKELDPSIFCKIHRSYVVNTTKVEQRKTSSVIINEFELPLSRNCSLNL